MKRHGNLHEKITSFENLLDASRKSYRGKRTRWTVAPYYFNLESEILELQDELIAGTHQPKAYRVFTIREPKVRKICASQFRDRVVHHAICNYLGPIFDKKQIYDSYACHRGKGSHAAIRRTQYFARRHRYFLKCDIQRYFPSIDHEVLKRLLRRVVKDRPLLILLDRLIDHSVPENPPGKGIPIGNLTSQYFANFYLGELDHFLKERLRVKGYIRYMDDFVCFSEDKESLHRLLGSIREFLDQRLRLELKEKVTRIAPVTEGVPFLGFRTFPNLIRLQRSNLVRFRRKIKSKEAAYQRGEISDTELAKSVNSMVAHISHADSISLRRRELERSLHLA